MCILVYRYEFLYWLVLISRLYHKFWLFLKNCIKISSFFWEANRRLLLHNNIEKTGILPVILRDDCNIFHFLIFRLLIIIKIKLSVRLGFCSRGLADPYHAYCVSDWSNSVITQLTRGMVCILGMWLVDPSSEDQSERDFITGNTIYSVN